MVDELDKRILAVLDWEGRLPATRIAKRVRSNKDVVISRIHKLEQSGVIASYYPVLNLRTLGYYTHRLNFDTVELTAEREDEFVQFLDKELNAGLIYRMDAPHKYGVYVWTTLMYELEGLLMRVKKFLGPQLTGYRYHLLCTINQYPKDAVFGKGSHTTRCRIANSEAATHDDADLRILRELACNARASTTELSKKTGIPQQTISYKMKAMERKGIILGYRAEIAIQQLGFEHYAFEVYLADQSDVDKLAAWAHVDPHVTWFETSIGGLDTDFVLEVRDRAQLDEKLDALRHRFPNIRKLLFYTERYWKLTYVP